MNQMEAITQLSRVECDGAIQQLAIAPEILAAIPGAELSGNRESSKDGDRVVLCFQLPASVRSEPIVLVGWLRGEVQHREVQHSEIPDNKGLDSETLDRGVMP